jgi:glutamine amidotransferase
MRVAIIDYGSGNLRSVAKAFERVAKNAASIHVTSSPEALAGASHIVLPGVGAFADCMSGLKALPGMLDALNREVLQKGKQFLGICVGMQMLFEKGHEHGVHEGLGWLKGEVVALSALSQWERDGVSRGEGGNAAGPHPNPLPKGEGVLKIPHMGWNNLKLTGSHPLLKDIKNGDHAYFVHSYHAICKSASDVLATVDYGQTITAVVGNRNIMGTQFHPEKSQETGLKLIKNFLDLQ